MKTISVFFKIAFLFFLCASCEDDAQNDVAHGLSLVEVQYVEQTCCGNMIITNNTEIVSNCVAYQDSLLMAINLEDFNIPQNYQFGDILTIEFNLMPEVCEANCDITCNRYNGIPVEITNVY